MTPASRSSLLAELSAYMEENRSAVHQVLHHFKAIGRAFLLRSDVEDAFAELADGMPELDLWNSPLATVVSWCQEAAVNHGWIHFALRPRIGEWFYVRIHFEAMTPEEVDCSIYLLFKESLISNPAPSDWELEVDLGPFSREIFKLKEADSIGRGVEFLNRRLSSRLFEEGGIGNDRLLGFLRLHRYRDQTLMLSDSISDVPALREALRAAIVRLRHLESDTVLEDEMQRLRQLGFEPGWGRTVGQALETMQLLLDILEAPSPKNLEDFLARVPMIFSVAILSIHGWFGQSNVLGRPDTGGQVVYILDQVRALEREMRERLEAQGLEIEPRILVLTRLIPEAEGTTCDQRLEPIAGTRSAAILRVPFRNEAGDVLPNWISRFEVWPYLERYASDAQHEMVSELGGRPDLIIGNYSDGNLVGSLMAQKLGVTQCNIAHALEKTKYLLSDLYWRESESNYHFSCQFTADLIAMNTADFIITSTYQEIAGTEHTVGQYESYMTFTMPDLYRVVHGTDVYDPKFNIVSPGADPEVYFPYTESEHRLTHLADDIAALLDGQDTGDDRRGALAEPDKPLLFTMARLDWIKNITGLVEWYGENEELRSRANLLVISGHIDPSRSQDDEERTEIERMHAIMDHHQLDGQVRWLGMHLDKGFSGELYRTIADRKGAFVQPARFEAFGLTVIEAMSSGLPTFATRFGGPLEIIRDGVSGFHIDPNHGDEAAARMAEFFKRCQHEPGYWDQISRRSLARIADRYTWRNYAERLMTLARVYGFWHYVTDLERDETRRYMQMFYTLQFRPRALALQASGE
jgi:sucrose synthase